MAGRLRPSRAVGCRLPLRGTAGMGGDNVGRENAGKYLPFGNLGCFQILENLGKSFENIDASDCWKRTRMGKEPNRFKGIELFGVWALNQLLLLALWQPAAS